ncbi:Monoterpene synthase 25 [Psilocybe cubensis]|uniref:Monoterpene synthase 25 n=2 Tax=Psilocybe cubensis TaxID=181762 RepID=A0ACB8GSB6_PSICU|nr:Monoterpene synthase 25 [Psilocybe cubensis]KAH9478551.1 Monoterpene synthase 25 [Psilocybe cubensis]
MAAVVLPETEIQQTYFQSPLTLIRDEFDGGKNNWVDTFKEIITKFVKDLDYRPEEPITEDNPTYRALRSEFLMKYDNGNEFYDQMYRTAVTMAELSYRDHAPEIRLEIARFTCFLLHVDDLGKSFNTLEGLQKRILMGDNSDGEFLQAFRKNLIGFYDLYDPIPANSITLAAISCISGMLLEQNDAVRGMKLSESSKSWPNYLRSKTGCSESYAYMLFPKSLGLEMTTYISVMEDIVFITNAANDILSFYKEFLGGETDTYIFLRARITNKPLVETLQLVVKETLEANDRVTKTLQSTDAYGLWKQYVNGYLGLHFTVGVRYRLNELEL